MYHIWKSEFFITYFEDWLKLSGPYKNITINSFYTRGERNQTDIHKSKLKGIVPCLV